jgi:hypothetical protein
MKLRFGQARSLYAKQVHPRLLIGPTELEDIRRSIASGKGRKVMEALRLATRPCIEALASREETAKLLSGKDSWGSIPWQVVAGAFDMAMIGVLDEDAAAIAAVGQVIRALPESGIAANDGILVHAGLTYPLLAFDLLHDRLDAQDRKAFAAWVIDVHVRRFLAKWRDKYFKGSGMNLTLGGTLPAILAVLLISGENGIGRLDAELAELLKFFEASLNTAIGHDGYPEEDTGYGTDFLTLLFRVTEVVRRSGDFDALDRCPHLARSGRALLSIVEPWGVSLATTGDAGDHFHNRHHLLPRLATLTNDPTLVWLMGVLRQEEGGVELAPGRDGFPAIETPVDAFTLIYLDEMAHPVAPNQANVPTSFHDRARGFVAFRDGWKTDDTLLTFDGSQRSPSGAGHYHASSGHFNFSALGEYFAIDTGRYNMDQDQHNLVLVDGKSGRPSEGQWVQAHHGGRLTDYRPGPLVDFAAADSSHQHNCFWARRSIGLVKGRGVPAYTWIVEDVNKANDWAEFWWALNTSPENTIRCGKRSATIRGCLRGNFLDVHFALPPKGSYIKPHTLELLQDEVTSGSYQYVSDPHGHAAKIKPPRAQVHHSVYVRPRLVAKVSGYNGRFMSLLLPRRKGEAAAKFEQLPTIDNALAVRVTHPASGRRAAVVDTLIWAYEHRLLEVDDIVGRGDWCLVRRDARTGRVLDHAIGNGTRLSVAGKALPVTSI